MDLMNENVFLSEKFCDFDCLLILEIYEYIRRKMLRFYLKFKIRKWLFCN